MTFTSHCRTIDSSFRASELLSAKFRSAARRANEAKKGKINRTNMFHSKCLCWMDVIRWTNLMSRWKSNLHFPRWPLIAQRQWDVGGIAQPKMSLRNKFILCYLCFGCLQRLLPSPLSQHLQEEKNLCCPEKTSRERRERDREKRRQIM